MELTDTEAFAIATAVIRKRANVQAKRDIKALTEYVEANPGEPINLADLAVNGTNNLALGTGAE